MSKGGGSTQTTTTTQKADPWKPAQPYLLGGLQDLSKWYSSDYGRNPYPGSTVVPFSPFTEQALGMAANRAVQGSPLIGLSKDVLSDTLSGKYLDPNSNPWLSGTYDLASGKVQSSLDSRFGAGNKGVDPASASLHYGNMAANLNDLATQIYGGNYQTERDRQMQAMLFAPQMAHEDYYDAGMLQKVGLSYEQQAQKNLQDSIDRYNFYNEEPINRLMKYFGAVDPIAGLGSSSTGTSSQKAPDNTFSQILGTGLTLLSFL